MTLKQGQPLKYTIAQSTSMMALIEEVNRMLAMDNGGRWVVHAGPSAVQTPQGMVWMQAMVLNPEWRP